MPQYVLRLIHASDQCPTSNSKIRERVQQGSPEMPKLAQKLGVKFTAGPYVLGAEHETIAVMEAESVEVIEDFLMQSGLIQWNIVKVSPAKLLQDALQDLNDCPPAIY